MKNLRETVLIKLGDFIIRKGDMQSEYKFKKVRT